MFPLWFKQFFFSDNVLIVVRSRHWHCLAPLSLRHVAPEVVNVSHEADSIHFRQEFWEVRIPEIRININALSIQEALVDVHVKEVNIVTMMILQLVHQCRRTVMPFYHESLDIDFASGQKLFNAH
jgi:hypothetical protein